MKVEDGAPGGVVLAAKGFARPVGEVVDELDAVGFGGDAGSGEEEVVLVAPGVGEEERLAHAAASCEQRMLRLPCLQQALELWQSGSAVDHRAEQTMTDACKYTYMYW